MNKMHKVEINGWALMSIAIFVIYGIVSLIVDMIKPFL